MLATVNQNTSNLSSLGDGFTESTIYTSLTPMLAEKALVGSILNMSTYGDAKEFFEIASRLINGKESFIDSSCYYVWRAFERIHERAGVIDHSSVMAELESVTFDGKTVLERIGGVQYISSLQAVGTADIEGVSRIVAHAAVRRTAIAMSDQVKRLSNDSSMSSDEIVALMRASTEQLENAVARINSEQAGDLVSVIEDGLKSIKDTVALGGSVFMTKSGVKPLDDMIGGFGPFLYTFAGPTNIGKTGLALTFALNALGQDRRILFVSTELSRKQLVARIISNLSGVDSAKIMRGELTTDDIRKLDAAANHVRGLLSSKEFIILDEHHPKLSTIMSAIRDSRFSGKPDLVIIDYAAWHQITPENDRYQINPRIWTGTIFSSLSKIANRHGIPTVVFTNMNRDVDHRPDHHPELSDLAESGAIEVVSEVVCFLYSDEYWGVPDAQENVVELIVKKNRSGAGRSAEPIKLVQIKELSRYGVLSLQDEQ